MKTFFDSSAFAKRYVEEQGSQDIDDLCMQTSELGLSVICIPEIVSALNRRLRERVVAHHDYVEAKRRLAEDVRDADIVDLTSEVISNCIGILECYPVRAMDALHVACALAWEAELFVSSDKRQLSAARKSGLQVKEV